jgi:hypothetical protein
LIAYLKINMPYFNVLAVNGLGIQRRCIAKTLIKYFIHLWPTYYTLEIPVYFPNLPQFTAELQILYSAHEGVGWSSVANALNFKVVYFELMLFC